MDVETLKFPIFAMKWEDYCKSFCRSDHICPRCRCSTLHLDGLSGPAGREYLCPECGPIKQFDVMMNLISAPHQLKPALIPSGAFNIEDRGAIVLYQLRNPFRFNLPFPPGAWLGRLIGWFFGTIARVWTLQVSCISRGLW